MAGLHHLHAEIVLSVFVLLCLLLDALLPTPLKKKYIPLAACLACVSALYALWGESQKITAGSFLFDHFASAPWVIPAKCFLLMGYVFSLFIVPWRGKDALYGLWVCLLTTLWLGTCLMVSAHSLLSLYLSAEITATAAYLMVPMYLRREDYQAGIKYLLFGIFSMGLSLYGISLWYGMGGSLYLFDEAVSHWVAQQNTWHLAVVWVLILSTFFFKISLFPMHFWTPIVYARMPLPALAMLSTLSKGAAWIALWKLCTTFQAHAFYPYVLSTFITLSILWGSLGALQQKDMRGLLAYGSIAYGGFLSLSLLPYAAEPLPSLGILLYAWVAYSLAYYILILIADRAEMQGFECLQGLSALRKGHGITKIALLVALISLIGLPPTAGFTAKFLLISTALQSFFASQKSIYLLAASAGLIGTLLSLFFYLKPLYFLFIQKEEREIASPWHSEKKTELALLLLSLGLIILFALPNSLIRLIAK